MDRELPLLLEKIGFLPVEVARAAEAEKDPVGFCLRKLSAQGKVGQAFEALLSTDLALSVADRLPDWCRRAEEYIAAAKAGILPDTVELARQAPSARERRTPRQAGREAPTPLAPGADEDTAREDDSAPVASRPAERPTRAVPPDSPSALPDRYEVVGLLGKGGMGTVYEVGDRELGRTVALKILGQKTEIATKRFMAEVRATAKLEHPNILPSYSVDTDSAGRLYFTMMKISGKTFRDAMESEPLETCVRALEKAARGVAHAHRQGILHRDLKPGNIMLGEHGEVWVLDWGLVGAKIGEGEERGSGEAPAREGLTRAGVTIGTPGYMAPEQAQAGERRIGPPADVHGLGAVLYELLTEERPYGGQTSGEVVHQMSLGPPPWPEPPAPPALAAIAMKSLAQNTRLRYQTAEEFADDLTAFLTKEPVSAYRAPLPLRLVAWVRRHVVLFSIAVVAGLAVAATAGVLGGRARLETAASAAREGEKEREEASRRESARKGLDQALESARASQARRLRELKSYAAPFERVYVGDETPDELRDRVFLPQNDTEIARAQENWHKAATEARIHLKTLDAARSEELDLQELDWAIEVALAHEGAVLESRWIERLRKNDPAIWKPVTDLVAKGVTSERAERVLAGTGKLVLGPIPKGAEPRLLEIVTTKSPFEPKEVERQETLRIGSYDLVVTRDGTAFHFPVLVERERTKYVDFVIPDTVPEGFVWIPPGDFLEGGDAEDAFPRHRRKLEKGFYLGRTEVTFGEYIEFLRTVEDRSGLLPVVPAHKGYEPVLAGDLSMPQGLPMTCPVFGVTRMAAERYVAWRSPKGRLPTEFEWARTAGGADGRVYVWGDEFDPAFANVGGEFPLANVGSHPRDQSIFGVFDMAGSLCEWTATDLSDKRVAIRGGSWAFAEDEARRAYRWTALRASDPRKFLGFRAAVDPH